MLADLNTSLFKFSISSRGRGRLATLAYLEHVKSMNFSIEGVKSYVYEVTGSHNLSTQVYGRRYWSNQLDWSAVSL